jgi:CxxC motif-containing protein
MRELVCFVCPNSCRLVVIEKNNELKVYNNRCPLGIDFARREINDPERTLTSTIKIDGGELPLVSVRSNNPVKRYELRDLIKQLDSITISAPISIGQVVMRNMGIKKVNIIATRQININISGVSK